MDFRAHLNYFGWTQREFAERIGVQKETVSRWNNKPPKLVILYLEERKAEIEFNKETIARLARFMK